MLIKEGITMEEIFNPIKDYEGLYEVSNYGIVKSLCRTVTRVDGRTMRIKEKLLKLIKNNNGYYNVHLCKNGKMKFALLHQLVWDNFTEMVTPKGFEIDHIDGNKLNNCIDNLQLLSHRENCAKGWQQLETKYPTGVSWNKNEQRFIAQIQLSGVLKKLGYFDNVDDASEAYKIELNKNYWTTTKSN